MIVKEVLPNGLTLVTEVHAPRAQRGHRRLAQARQPPRDPRADRASATSSSTWSSRARKNRPAEVIAAQVDSIGGHMDAFTAKEYASFHLKVLDEHLPLAVDILGDIVPNPLFDPEEMAKEKKVIFEEINMVEDTPDDLVMELLHRGLLARPSAGPADPRAPSAASPASSATELAAFFRDVYRPGEHPDRRRRPPRPQGDLGARPPPLRRPGRRRGARTNGGPPRPRRAGS